MSETPEMRMNAYYYGFAPTGVIEIDRILSAVAHAGKAFHHTDSWCDSECGPREGLRGDSPVEWIQNAANDAAMLHQAATDKVSVVDPMPVLRQFVKTFPSQRHAAAKLGISQQYLTDILHGRRDFSDRILQAVGLQRVIIATEAKP